MIIIFFRLFNNSRTFIGLKYAVWKEKKLGKIIVLDYDGCVIPNGQPNRVNASSFHAQILADILKKEQANIVFCSSRGLDSLEEAARNFEGYGMKVINIVAEDGSFIKDRKTGKIETIAKLAHVELIRKIKSFFIDFAYGNYFVVQDGKQAVLTLLRDEQIYTSDQFYMKSQDIISYLISSGLLKDTDLEKIEIVQTFEGVEIYPASAGTDKALRRIFAQIWLDEVIIGVGDEKNDAKWLKLLKNEFAGIIVASENAVDQIKIIADYVGKGENIKGLLDALYKCFGYYTTADKNEQSLYYMQV